MLHSPFYVLNLSEIILDIWLIILTCYEWPSPLENLKLVQMSDLHYDGYSLSREFLAEVIILSNQENPDLVLLTGDYITDDPNPIYLLVEQLRHLKSRYGIYACLGNHDIEHPAAKTQVIKALEQIDIQVLWNAIAYPLGTDLPLVGLADYWSKEFYPKKVLELLDPQVPRLVLSHNPDSAAALKNWRVDLQLSGHTHGGQVGIPGYGPAPKLVKQLRQASPRPVRSWIPFLRECAEVMRNWQWGEGLHWIGTNQLYVNRGLGSYFPGRLFCPPELTVITLRRQF
jgi:predicted MPP superfamily phosphohydrolase